MGLGRSSLICGSGDQSVGLGLSRAPWVWGSVGLVSEQGSMSLRTFLESGSLLSVGLGLNLWAWGSVGLGLRGSSEEATLTLCRENPASASS